MIASTWPLTPALLCVVRLAYIVASRRVGSRWSIAFVVELLLMAAIWFVLTEASANPALIGGSVLLSATITAFAVGARMWTYAIALVPLLLAQDAITFAVFAASAGVFAEPSCWPGEYVSYMRECDYN